MKIKLENMSLSEFDKFLEFSRKKENGEFKVILKGGIDIFEQGEKISMIWRLIGSAQGGFKAGDVVYEINNPRKRNILLQDKIKKTKETYNKLKEEFDKKILNKHILGI